MTDPSPATTDATPLPTGVPGVELHPGPYQDVIAALRTGIAALAANAAADTGAAAEPLRRVAVPPVISRRTIERAGYAASFPHLLGTVHGFTGTSREWRELAPLVATGGEWHARQEVTDLVLLPAACYPLYELLAGLDVTDAAPRFSVEAQCFRQEATSEPGRLRSFRMAELVTAGTPAHCTAWRDQHLDLMEAWLTALGLKPTVEVADDPFFGGGRKVFQAAQRAQQLKFELRVPLADGVVQAVASANLHKDHFGEVFGFTAAGAPGHTSCAAFGLDRIARALLHTHGPRPSDWPADLARALEGGRA